MGSYLEINNRETNSTTWSKILIEVIRDIDSGIKKNTNSTEKEKKYFIPRYYKVTDAKTKKLLGCGDWKINKKGMALVVSYLKNMYEDEEIARRMAIEEYKCNLEELDSEDELNKKIEQYTQKVKEDILWCYNYAVDVLTDMVLTGMKRVKVHWV